MMFQRRRTMCSTASSAMALDIFDWPAARFTKTIGISFTRSYTLYTSDAADVTPGDVSRGRSTNAADKD